MQTTVPALVRHHIAPKRANLCQRLFIDVDRNAAFCLTKIRAER